MTLVNYINLLYNYAMKIIAGILLLVCLVTPLCRAEEDKSISGTVVDIDWVKSTLTVRYYDLYSGDNDEINIKITPDTNMSRGTDSISLSDIDQLDPINVTYYDDGVSGLKAKRLTDLNLANQ